MKRWLTGMALLLLLAGCATDQSGMADRVSIAEPRQIADPLPVPTQATIATEAISAPVAIVTPAQPPLGKSAAAKPKLSAQLAHIQPLVTKVAPQPPGANKAAAGDGPRTSMTADGTASYYVPNKMIEKAPSVIHLWIDPVMPVKDLQESLARQLRLDIKHIKVQMEKIAPTGATMAGDVQGLAKVRVGDRMFAQLSGNDFEFSPKEQMPGELDGTTWKWHWQATPQRASESQPLLLTIKAWIDESPRQTSMPSIDEPVLVQADPSIIERIKRWTKLIIAIEDFYKALAALTVILVGLGVTFRKQLCRILRIGGGPG